MTHPVLINCLQKVSVYETRTTLYVIGSNSSDTLHRVLKIDRTIPKDLILTDDQRLYSNREVKDILVMLDTGNRVAKSSTSGFSKTYSGFGLLGFVRFLEGYYMVLITKRRKAAVIGNHLIYKVEETALVYIPNDSVRVSHSDEHKYLKLFQSVDLSSNFYFSFSYDVTHTLQYFLTPLADPHFSDLPFGKLTRLQPGADPSTPPETSGPSQASGVPSSGPCMCCTAERLRCLYADQVHEKIAALPFEQHKLTPEGGGGRGEGPPCGCVYGVKWEPAWRYVWNEHLLQPMVEAKVHPDWLIHVIHGFVGHSEVVAFGKPLFLTLIARRSNKFAGTRFLKRGANYEGYVANEVETEQILQDGSMSDLDHARITSFVQLRGSLPIFWSQDISKMIPKPAIILDQADPYGFVSGQHFNRVLSRYGAPLIILNLVKTREKRRREAILTEELVHQLDQLNQFLPSDHAIKYIGFDISRVSKRKDSTVFERLSTIAEACVKNTSFFQSRCLYNSETRPPNPRLQGLWALPWAHGFKQQGVVRTNCVDCLDRTNTAQFAIGKHALALQLYIMGLLEEPNLPFESDCIRMLEELYEDHGDTLALQYGGSQLVHRIKGYRNVMHWTSHSKDIMQTLSRYYSNTFSDADKQHAINVFLGVYKPRYGLQNVWDLPTDFYLHNPQTVSTGQERRVAPYTQWWSAAVWESLPGSADERFKGLTGDLHVLKTLAEDERVDIVWEFYKPYQMTVFDVSFLTLVPNSIRDFAPKNAQNLSPFVERAQPGRREEELGIKNPSHNPNVSGRDSTASVVSGGSEGSSSSDSEDSDMEGDLPSMRESTPPSTRTQSPDFNIKTALPTMRQTYGLEIIQPSLASFSYYKRFAQIAENASYPIPATAESSSKHTTVLIHTSRFPLNSTFCVVPPQVSTKNREMYTRHVNCQTRGAQLPSSINMKLYSNYANSYQQNKLC